MCSSLSIRVIAKLHLYLIDIHISSSSCNCLFEQQLKFIQATVLYAQSAQVFYKFVVILQFCWERNCINFSETLGF